MKILVNDAQNDKSMKWHDAIKLAAQKLYEQGYVKDNFAQKCIERELKYPTGLETEIGVAIPHTESDYVNENAISIIRLKNPVKFHQMDDPEKTVDAYFVCNLAIHEKREQVVYLSKLIGVLQDSEKLKKLYHEDIKTATVEFQNEIIK